MAKITRIKASDEPSSEKDDASDSAVTRKKVTVKDKKSEKNKRKELRAKEKAVKGDVNNIDKGKKPSGDKTSQKTKKPFILFRPFVALWRYLKDAWGELRQVRWPNRKATWKMVLAVIVYTAVFVIFISLLDLFFSWLFNIILSK